MDKSLKVGLCDWRGFCKASMADISGYIGMDGNYCDTYGPTA